MNSRTDILTLGDVTNLVNTFYDKVRQNDLLGPVFNDRIGDKWPEHLEKMYRFWQTVIESFIPKTFLISQDPIRSFLSNGS